jgi:hypothetical protein
MSDQSVAIGIVEDELDRMKQDLSIIKMEKNNKKRLIEINKYYGDKYSEHSNLMKIIIFTLVPIIILTLIYRTGVLPKIVFTILFFLIIVVGLYYFWFCYTSIIMRDPMDYNEYDWFFNPATAPKPPKSTDKTDPWLNGDSGVCVGHECCTPGQTYNDKIEKCVTNTGSSGSTSASSKQTETFVNNVLTKTNTTNKYKGNNMFNSAPNPFNFYA